jgi:succinate dehydrogenase/fumarate reductase flavoprotein subunit
MNMELIAALDASLMLDLAQAAISAAKARKESCGAHYLI